MLRVLQVSSDTNIGGAGKCILTYLKHYDKTQIEVALVLPKDSLLKSDAQKLGIRVFEIDAMQDRSLDIKAISRLIGVYKEFKPDIVHTHASMSARLAARLYHAKIVYTRHSVFPPDPKLTHGPLKAACGLINNITADKIIAVAEAAKQNICDIGVSDKKIEVIFNGVEPLREYTSEEITKTKAKLGVPEGFKCAAMVARLNEVKGHKYFVEAAKILKQRGITAKFLIAGTGDMEGKIRKQIEESGLSDDVLMLGFVKDVEPLMNIVDVSVNCSFGTEATSLSLLEGMSLGKPAVVSDFGGNPGVISDGHNGFVVPARNAEAFAERIAELLCNEELYQKMSEESMKVYNSLFTAKRYAENIDNIYLNLGGKYNG